MLEFTLGGKLQDQRTPATLPGRVNASVQYSVIQIFRYLDTSNRHETPPPLA